VPEAFATESDRLDPGSALRCEVAGQPLLLARLEDGLYAVHDTCLHRGASLSALPLEGAVATCHLHFWKFDVRSGACLQVESLRLRTYPVRERDGKIYVEV
jgi:nitrite reductase/ring-hydroxylating ferredoxin subunit